MPLFSKYNKNMLTLLMILLFALVITSAIGGSIKVTENFWEDMQTDENPENLEITKETTTVVETPVVPPVITTKVAPTTADKMKVKENIVKDSADMTGDGSIEPFQGNMFAGI